MEDSVTNEVHLTENEVLLLEKLVAERTAIAERRKSMKLMRLLLDRDEAEIEHDAGMNKRERDEFVAAKGLDPTIPVTLCGSVLRYKS